MPKLLNCTALVPKHWYKRVPMSVRYGYRSLEPGLTLARPCRGCWSVCSGRVAARWGAGGYLGVEGVGTGWGRVGRYPWG